MLTGQSNDVRATAAQTFDECPAHLLNALAHANEPKPIMAMGGGESVAVIRELQPNLLFFEVEARFEPSRHLRQAALLASIILL